MGLLRDLHDLWLAASGVHLEYEAVNQAAKALHDQSLMDICEQDLPKYRSATGLVAHADRPNRTADLGGLLKEHPGSEWVRITMQITLFTTAVQVRKRGRAKWILP